MAIYRYINMKEITDLVFEDYQMAIAAYCFHDSFEEFEEWKKAYCLGVCKNGHPDPPGEPGEEGPPGPGSD